MAKRKERRRQATTEIKTATSHGMSRSGLALVGAAALGMRLLHLWIVGKEGVEALFLDSKYYAVVAQSIRQGIGVGDHPYLLSPLYPYLLAVFPASDGFLAVGTVRVFQAIAGAVTAVLAADIACRVGGGRTGVVAGVTAALYGPLIFFDSRILVASFKGLCLTLAVWCLVAEYGESSSRRVVLANLGTGLALGIGATLRPTFLVVLAAVIVAPWTFAVTGWIQRQRLRQLLLRSILIGGAAAVAVLPFTIRNTIVAGEAILLSANGGFNFWIGNHADANGVFDTPPGHDLVDDPVGRNIASRRAGRELTYREANAWWLAEAARDIRQAPGRWIRLLIRKAALLCHPEEIPQLGSSFEWHRRSAWTLRFPLDTRHLLILALASPFVLILRDGFAAARRIRWPLLAAVTYMLTVAFFFVAGRYRAPVLPTLIALAATTSVGLWDLWIGSRRKRSRGLVGVTTAVLILLVASYPMYGRGSPLRFEETFEAEERHIGMAYAAQGEFEEAESAYRRSLGQRDTDDTRTNLALALKGQGRLREAVAELKFVVSRNPQHGVAWYNLGNLQAQLGDPESAIESYRNAIRYRSRFAEAHFSLGAALLEVNRPKEAVGPIRRGVELGSPTDDWYDRARDMLTIAEFLSTRSDD